MLAEERFHEIIRLVNERKTMTVQELTELLDSSESTIRRDLTELHKRHQLVKVHGGATALQMGYTTKDEAVSVRKDMNMEEKQRIAKYAAERIEKNDFVYVDAGTTTGCLIDWICEQGAVFVTNGISCSDRINYIPFRRHLSVNLSVFRQKKCPISCHRYQHIDCPHFLQLSRIDNDVFLLFQCHSKQFF